MQINERLKLIRELNNKTQEEIAEELNTTQQQYWKYEKGKQEIPVRHIITLARIYNTTTDELLGITKEIDPIGAEEQQVIQMYRSLTEREKGRILERMKILIESTNKINP